jgi:transcriptional regulator with XRE-family HTH domain
MTCPDLQRTVFDLLVCPIGCPTDMADLRSLAHLIYEARMRRGWNQTVTGEWFGVGQPEVSKWESGRKKPGGELLPKVAEFLGITIDEVVAAKHNVDLSKVGAVATLYERVEAVEAELAKLSGLPDAVEALVAQLSVANDQLELISRSMRADRKVSGPPAGASPPSKQAAATKGRGPARRPPGRSPG